MQNVNSIHCCRWYIATDESEVDYWKSEVILFLASYCDRNIVFSMKNNNADTPIP